MKVRIEFDPRQEPGMDDESIYDAVEFSTVQAGDPEKWGDAVLDFIRPAVYGPNMILFEALYLKILDGELPPFFMRDYKGKAKEIISWLEDGIKRSEEKYPTKEKS